MWRLYWTSYKVEGPRAQAVADFKSAPLRRTLAAAPPGCGCRPPRSVDSTASSTFLHGWMKIPLGEAQPGRSIGAGPVTTRTPRNPGSCRGFSVAAPSFLQLLPFHRSAQARTTGRCQETNDLYLVTTPTSPTDCSLQTTKRISIIAPVPKDLTTSSL